MGMSLLFRVAFFKVLDLARRDRPTHPVNLSAVPVYTWTAPVFSKRSECVLSPKAPLLKPIVLSSNDKELQVSQVTTEEWVRNCVLFNAPNQSLFAAKHSADSTHSVRLDNYMCTHAHISTHTWIQTRRTKTQELTSTSCRS